MEHGRTVRAYEVGPPDGPLVVAIHGAPSTGLSHVTNYVANGALFCRLVTFDRQGYGGSTPQPGRKVCDIVPIVEAILDHLSVDTAAVYGHSAGGMHALATAALLPKRISRLLCSGANAPDFVSGASEHLDKLSPLVRQEILEARKGPEGSRAFYRRWYPHFRDPEIEKQFLTENDRRVARLHAPFRDKIAQQLALPEPLYSEEDAYVDDMQSWLAPWGFDVDSVTVPTRIVYGLEDLWVTRRDVEWMHAQIPNSTLDLIPHFGHNLSQLIPHIFAWLVQEELQSRPATPHFRPGA
ncbi:putative Alpha/beta hydrolase fold protein [Mesorhizobium delmotii]|uniref:Putative Alpha/beta hydrolase fold protein n=2 Tax=Mesorhizobium delmotii TaxID=1631247 RepID=A0A2P9AG69_9HYPH|nr:putative Alpha/beta hydrolase fold protein [Mesorhizobium delmotii]